MTDRIPVRVITGGEDTTIRVETGANLRESLLEHDLPVYGTVSRYANGGGRGLCSTCTVEVDPAPTGTTPPLFESATRDSPVVSPSTGP